ncbi:hypothetical protein BBJ28_00009365 [Nothophytophthora sp. Chile5]|nr:hypothetical protein BBJ28_00009365 [Nothophytophthora sp. Chile5]
MDPARAAHQDTDAEPSDDEELQFLFEREDEPLFRPIGGFERPSHPMAAVLERREAHALRPKRVRGDELNETGDHADDPGEDEEKAACPLPVPVSARRKRKTFDRPTELVTKLVRPTPKRLKSGAYERSVTAPACLMGSLSLHRSRPQEEENPPPLGDADELHEPTTSSARSAAVSIPNMPLFRPIHWPGDAAVAGRERSHSCSSSSSAKSWASGLGRFCRHSLDVASPLRVRLSDLVLGSTVSRAGSYTGS